MTVRPLAMIATSSQSSTTSWMMWLERMMHVPSSRMRLSAVLKPRALGMSNPLVGSSSSRFFGV